MFFCQKMISSGTGKPKFTGKVECLLLSESQETDFSYLLNVNMYNVITGIHHHIMRETNLGME